MEVELNVYQMRKCLLLESTLHHSKVFCLYSFAVGCYVSYCSTCFLFPMFPPKLDKTVFKGNDNFVFN